MSVLQTCLDRPLVVVGGGDGTLRSAAEVILQAKNAPALGILPLGTHNHLARQLGIPLDPREAIAVVANGQGRRIDAASVNHRIFLNNASIGLYPLLVRWREEERHRRGLPKWLANVIAARAVLQRLRHHRLRVTIEGRERAIRTPLLFVGNNIYSLEAGRIGERVSLDQGRLSVFAVETHSRLSGLWFAARTLAGRADPERDFAVLEAPAGLGVDAHATAIQVALDGEVHCLATPLHFRSLPGALRVITPA